MEANKFETTVLESGIIKVPKFEKYANRKVEVFCGFYTNVLLDIALERQPFVEKSK